MHLPDNFIQVLIVAGGWDRSQELSSTELMTYLPGSVMMWRQAEPLPRAMKGFRMVNLNNNIYLFGGISDADQFLDSSLYGHIVSHDILRYKDGVWDNVGKMKTARVDHAVSVVNYKDMCKSD